MFFLMKTSALLLFKIHEIILIKTGKFLSNKYTYQGLDKSYHDCMYNKKYISQTTQFLRILKRNNANLLKDSNEKEIKH